jgi:hypothetical protein
MFWNRPWEELLSARGHRCTPDHSFHRQLNLKELGQLPGEIHHNAVGMVIRRFTQRPRAIAPSLKRSHLSKKN